jgi:uroporphyrinogen III methyltransferase / synthase
MEQLCAAGRPADTPAAVIEWGTYAAQRTVSATIATLADAADAAGIRPPALAVIGDVVRLRDKLAWFERKLLFGKRVVVTRPRSQASELAERLQDLGADVILLPTIEIAPPVSFAGLDAALRRPEEFDWVLFTSANGVRAFITRLRALELDLRGWQRARLAAIGPQTAAALQEYALKVDLVPDDYRAEGLAAELAKIELAGKRVLLPRAAGARAVLPEALKAQGALVEEVMAYRSVAASQIDDETAELVRSGAVDLVTFTSSSTVHNFATFLGDHLKTFVQRGAAVGCIGPITAATARQYGMNVVLQPVQYTVAGLVESIVQH